VPAVSVCCHSICTLLSLAPVLPYYSGLTCLLLRPTLSRTLRPTCCNAVHLALPAACVCTHCMCHTAHTHRTHCTLCHNTALRPWTLGIKGQTCQPHRSTVLHLSTLNSMVFPNHHPVPHQASTLISNQAMSCHPSPCHVSRVWFCLLY
jgi:hypothetical protein